MKKRSIALLIILCIFSLGIAMPVSADDSIPYGTYTYRLDDNDKKAVSIKQMYEFKTVIKGETLGLGDFSEPSDIACDNNGNVYLLDSGNSRIAVFTASGELIKLLSGLTYEGKEINFKGAQGLSVDKNGELLVADGENMRVLRINNEGVITGIMTKPESSIIPKDFNYQPIKAVSDSQGYTYVLSNGSYYGALVYNSSNEFCGFYGANEVQGGVLDAIGKLWKRLTMTEEKMAASEQKIPYQFIDMSIDENDFVYTLTGQTSAWSVNTGQIRRMNPAGKNVLKTYTGESASGFDFGDESNLRLDKSSQYKETAFEKIYVDEMGFIYAVDSNFGHIFIYDSKSNPLGIFGGDGGEQTATFEYAAAIAAHGGYVYVVDSAKNSCTVFAETEYGRLYKQAQKYSLNEENENAKPIWKEILRQDKNNQLAHRGLAFAYLAEGNYKDAISEARLGIDRTTYAVTFVQLRSDFFVKNTWWIIIAVVFVLMIIVTLAVLSKKNVIKINSSNELTRAFGMIIHPFEHSNKIKYDGKGSVGIATIFFVLLFLSKCIADLGIGFAFDSVDYLEYNAIITLAGTVGIALLFTVANWAVCVLAQGKANYREIYIVTGYSLLPLILNNFLQLIFSNILVPEEAAIMTVISAVAWIMAGIILSIGISIQQEYSFFKFIGTTALSVVAIGLIIFILFMLGILFQELFEFIESIYREIFYR